MRFPLAFRMIVACFPNVFSLLFASFLSAYRVLVACVSLDLSLAVRLIFACVSIASFALSLYSAAILLLLCYWPRDDGKANEKPRRYHRKTC